MTVLRRICLQRYLTVINDTSETLVFPGYGGDSLFRLFSEILSYVNQ